MQATGPVRVRRDLIEPCPALSLQRQCELVGISRSGFYYEPVPESEATLALMRRLDELHLERPLYGSRRLTALLQREGVMRRHERDVQGQFCDMVLYAMLNPHDTPPA